MRIGIIGLPGAGKTTLFRILTGGVAGASSQSGSYRVTTAVVPVPDPRVDALAGLYDPRKVTPAQLELADIAGMTAEGEPSADALSGELTNVIGRYDALLHVVRLFESRRSPHPLGALDAERDIRRVEADMLLSDLAKVENRLGRLEDSLKRGKVLPSHEADRAEQQLLQRLQPHLDAERPVRDFPLTAAEEKLLRGYQLLTAKPVLLVLNMGDDAPPPAEMERPAVAVRGRLESDLLDVPDEDRSMFMEEYGIVDLSGPKIIHAAYRLLDRMTFFTVGEDEVRAWEAPAGASALECAGAIHTDLAKGFIRAEVIGYDELMGYGGMPAAKAAGKVRLEGKDKVIADGDILVIRFNV